MKRVKMPKWLLIGMCVLLAIAFIGLGFYAVTKLTDWKFKTVNEDNLIQVDNYTLVDTKDKNADIQIDVTDDGQIVIEGENKTDDATEIEVVSILLEKGDYFISSGAKKCDKDTYYLVLRDSEGGEIVADNDFTVAEATSYTVYIVIQSDVEIDTTFSPVLVEGDKAGSFYTYNIFNK